MLPHSTVCANHDAMLTVTGICEDDVMVSWLPLYHDMGLIGMLAIPMTVGVDFVLASPQDFLADPGRWMEWMSDLQRHGHRRAELLLGPGGPGVAPLYRPARPVPRPDRAQRRRAGRSGHRP